MDVKAFLTNIIPIKNIELKKILEKQCKINCFAQGEEINEAGKVDYYIRFLVHGAVRGYIVDKTGKETTTSFVVDPGDVIAGSRMLDGSASEIGFEALKDSEVFGIPVDAVLTLRSKYQEIDDLQMLLLAQAAVYHWETRKMLYLKTAQERYEWFLEHYPSLIHVVNQYDIASFLNVTPVTLSRIKRDMKITSK